MLQVIMYFLDDLNSLTIKHESRQNEQFEIH